MRIVLDRLVSTDNITIDTAIRTGKKIGVIYPHICFRNNKTKTSLVIDINCSTDGNVARKHAEKLTKYGDL